MPVFFVFAFLHGKAVKRVRFQRSLTAFFCFYIVPPPGRFAVSP